MNVEQISALIRKRIADAVKAIELQKGDPGPKGNPGRDGEHGRDGKDGAPGKDGKDGLPGVGRNGKDGRDGRDGKDGLAGKDGAPGKSAEEKTVREWAKEFVAEFLKKNRDLFRGERGLSGVVIRDRMVVKDVTTTIEGARSLNFTGATVSDGGDGAANVAVTGGSGITQLTGDVIAGPGSGSQAATIADGAVGTAKLGGDITTAGKALLDDADNTAQRTTLGLGTAATAASADFDAAGSAAAAVAAHEGTAADVHGQYQKESEKDGASGYAGVDAAGAVLRALALRETSGPTNLVVGAIVDGEFLKRVGATIVSAAPGAGSTNIKQTEVDFGTTPVSEATFTITDSDVSPTSQIIASLAYEAPTGKDLDEIEMDQMTFSCGAGSGTFDMIGKPVDGGYVADKFKVNYLIG